MRMRRVGPYQLQAAIAALHDDAATTERRTGPQIAALYAALGRIAPSPVVELNRAVAVAMADGPGGRPALVDELAAAGQLDDYPYLHSTRADLLRRLGRRDEAGAAYAPRSGADRERAGAGVPRAADRGGPRGLRPASSGRADLANRRVSPREPGGERRSTPG